MPVAKDNSTLVVVGRNGEIKNQLDKWLSQDGWHCVQADALLHRATNPDESVALFVLDGSEGDAQCEAWISTIRAQDNPNAGAPILLVSQNAANIIGASALIIAPMEREATLSTIANWAGELTDHSFRDLDNPHYRLLRLGGRDVANEMLARLADSLDQALDYLEAPDRTSPLPHQIAGFSGMLGYHELSRHWRAIDGGDSADLEAAKAETRAVLRQIRDYKKPA